MILNLDTPALLLDYKKLEANINTMTDVAKKNGISIRPHIKTHKSINIAKMQIQAGAIGITVAKLGEAEVMAAGGITDILVAFPIASELDQAETIIRDYLTFAKPASTQSESMNIQSELIRVISVVTPLANYSNVRIDLSAIEGYIFGERSKFQQCLVNILKNAIESMPNGGYIFINVRTAKEKIIIEIKDEGVGMSPAALSKLGDSAN